MSVNLEAFESSIKNRRIRWFLTDIVSYPPGLHEQVFNESPPFLKRLLISGQKSSEAWKLVDAWDAVFVPTTPIEWSLILAYIQNIAKPSIVFITPEVQVPAAFYQKSAGLTTSVTFSFINSATLAPLVGFDATFFPSAHELENYVDQTNGILKSLVSGEIIRNFVLKDAIRDLRSAGATLVVSSIEESKSSLYWYYVSESHVKEKGLIDTVIQTLLRRGP
jgi:hypothetical protein